MDIEELHRIKALGNLIQYYHSDLTYIRNFQLYKQNKQNKNLRNRYLLKSSGSFQNFLNEFKIARNVRKNYVPELLDRTMDWVNTNQADDVDAFANKLREKEITQVNKTMTSLASKILFLNNPWRIFPCDTLNRRAVGVKTNRYSDFCSAHHDLMEREPLLIDHSLEPIQGFILRIEEEFKGKIGDISTIRRNRFIDKLLWVRGQKQT